MVEDKKPKWLDVEQNTDEWLALRVGKLGGSSIGKVMANFGKPFGKPARRLAHQIALEKLTGDREDDTFSNQHMERGVIEEPIARDLYMETTGHVVTNGGYFDVGEFIGFSPDGLVGGDGLIEIKSVIESVHKKTLKRGKYDPKYKWQMIFSLKYSGRDWIVYIEYCSEYPDGEQLFVDHISKENVQKEFNMIDERLGEFIDLINDKIDEIKYYTDEAI